MSVGLLGHVHRERWLDDLVRDLANRWRKSIPSVYSVGVGGSPTNPVIFVYTNRHLTKKQRAAIPAQIDGIQIVLRETGRVLPAYP